MKFWTASPVKFRPPSFLALCHYEDYPTLADVFVPSHLGFCFQLFETDVMDVETPHDFAEPSLQARFEGR